MDSQGAHEEEDFQGEESEDVGERLGDLGMYRERNWVGGRVELVGGSPWEQWEVTWDAVGETWIVFQFSLDEQSEEKKFRWSREEDKVEEVVKYQWKMKERKEKRIRTIPLSHKVSNLTRNPKWLKKQE